MVTWIIILSRQAVKDSQKLARAGYQPQTERLLRLLLTRIRPLHRMKNYLET